ncbi:hypothetical protein [Sphingomonas sp.]|uniref:hypothetical protein n=1 Tax=Sphingomonas sp. TaxID=28214 RepID=UPI00333F6228
MAMPPEPPKAPKSAKPATPAPRRSSRTASTAKAAPPKATTPRAAPPAAASEPKAPAAARPVPKRATTRKAVAPVVAPPARTKPATTRAAKPETASVPKVATADRRSLAAALPPVTPKTAWSLGAVALAAGAGIAAFLTRGRIMALLTGKPEQGHVPTDLLVADHAEDDRALPAFRPDMAAPMTAAEREALRPPPGLPN